MCEGEERKESQYEFNDEIQLATFKHVTAKYTCLYSTYDPEYVFLQLISKLTDF